MDDDLILTRTTVDGRPHWQTVDGRVFPVISGGDGSSDSGAGAGGGTVGDTKTAGTSTAAGGPPAQGTDGKTDGKTDDTKTDSAETITLTQADLDALVEKRLGKARKTWEAEAATAAERAKLDDVERLKAEKADAEKAAADARAAALAVRVAATAERAALAAGVRPDRVERFMRLVDLADVDGLVDDGEPDRDAIGKLVTKALDDVPEFKTTPNGRSGAEFNRTDERPKTLEEAVMRRVSAQGG
ncbi:MAG: DUF4355 domain-containing protein [Acidimicrobiia bacterium]|nr:DUF4355 domain-containing protein [Acidimicrobiia bacterium]